jgi:hypothetical protein
MEDFGTDESARSLAFWWRTTRSGRAARYLLGLLFYPAMVVYEMARDEFSLGPDALKCCIVVLVGAAVAPAFALYLILHINTQLPLSFWFILGGPLGAYLLHGLFQDRIYKQMWGGGFL